MSKDNDLTVIVGFSPIPDPSPKWYKVDIAAPHAIPDAWSNLVRERDNLPAWKDICARTWHQEEAPPTPDSIQGDGWAVAWVGGGSLDSKLCYQDFPDTRQVLIKTTRSDQIDEVRKLSGVTVTDSAPSGFYLVSGSLFNRQELEEEKRLIRAHGREGAREHHKTVADRFDTEVWPILKAGILDAIQKHDPAALLYFVDNDTAKAAFIKTDSSALVEALSNLDHGLIEEEPPGTTLENITACVQSWQGANLGQPEPSRPAEPEAKATVPSPSKT